MNIFITGGLTGMGHEAALLFMKDGHNVGICSFQSAEDATSMLPAGAKYYQADVTDSEMMKKAIYDFKSDFGTVDVVHANAGINHEKTTVPDWKKAYQVIDVNIKGVLNTFEPAIDIMKEQGSGHLVSVASVASYSGLPGMSVYGGSKAFIRNFTESLSLDLGRYGIDVTMIAPGFVATPLTAGNKHKMPFMITQKEGGQEIVKAIYKKKKIHIFPKPFLVAVSLLNHLPRPIYRMIMSNKLTD
jgi:short-subunit dehydrogenase